MNVYEAQLALHAVIRDVLLDLSEDEPTPDDIEAMGDVADMLLEALDLEVVAVNGNAVSCRVDLSYADQDDDPEAP